MKPSNLLPVNEIHLINPAVQATMKARSFIRLSTSAFALAAVMMCAPQGASASPKDTLNAADVAFVKQAAASGRAEVKLASLGAKKADRADVKAFAGMVAADHTKVNDELKALASTKGVELSAVMEAAHADKFQKLEKVSGKEFDKEFLAHMVSSHKKGISLYEKAAKDASDKDVKKFADKTLPALKSHLAKAEALTSKEVSAK